MMISKQLRNLLVQRGALERLRELNQELRVLATVFPVGRPRRLNVKQPRKVKQLHWTQRPENAARVRRNLRKAQRARR